MVKSFPTFLSKANSAIASLIFLVSTSSENVTQHPVDFNFSCKTPINWISMSSKTLLIVATHAICCRPNLLVTVTTLADIYWPFSLMRNSSQFNVFGGGRAIKQRRSAGTTCWKRSNFQIFILHRRRSPTIGKYVILCEPLACCFVSGSFFCVFARNMSCHKRGDLRDQQVLGRK